MRTFYLFEIEANELPIFKKGEWEHLSSLTCRKNDATSLDVFAYGEKEDNQFVELFEK
ncbi:hypothetical protein P8881_19600 [Bacillus haynesii]|uniref:hypothetical protein n=1 Tax=Bacillus haynesii TaxID=1925021 RepID=UPI0022808606|nr:hypothetical protein [Bacillus haynesii]MCY8737542.1 hypothetical protein [Bacillus haynesii]MEC0709732.1 hypothetical protein [Bacillus haynesii]MEC0736889.1 hypothetical protein [Bacillus haynesii]